MKWLNIGLSWKIAIIRTTPALVSYPKQVYHPLKRVFCFNYAPAKLLSWWMGVVEYGPLADVCYALKARKQVWGKTKNQEKRVFGLAAAHVSRCRWHSDANCVLDTPKSRICSLGIDPIVCPLSVLKWITGTPLLASWQCCRISRFWQMKTRLTFIQVRKASDFPGWDKPTRERSVTYQLWKLIWIKLERITKAGNTYTISNYVTMCITVETRNISFVVLIYHINYAYI